MQCTKTLVLTVTTLLCLFNLPSHAETRIVSTDAAVTQIIFALAMDDALAGVDVTSTLPPGYREIPVVGYHRALSPEGLLALNPTLVIGSEHIGPAKILSTLDSAGIPLLQLPTANTIEDLKQNIASIAEAMGDVSKAESTLAELDQQRSILAAAPLSEARIAFVLAVEPGKLRIAGNGTSGDAFITLLGADNIADFDAYRTVSAEAILDLAPTVILVAGHEGATPARLLELNSILRHSQAAKSGLILPVEAANLVAGLSPKAVVDAVVLTESIARQPVR
ncbi:Hemin-binding periplasmic protein HmuT [Halioglobus japonicus]|nr:Hemin-binding periplasmic protein HmuT [Halioglobus japonicus]